MVEEDLLESGLGERRPPGVRVGVRFVRMRRAQDGRLAERATNELIPTLVRTRCSRTHRKRRTAASENGLCGTRAAITERSPVHGATAPVDARRGRGALDIEDIELLDRPAERRASDARLLHFNRARPQQSRRACGARSRVERSGSTSNSDVLLASGIGDRAEDHACEEDIGTNLSTCAQGGRDRAAPD